MVQAQIDWVKDKMRKVEVTKNSNNVFKFMDELGLIDNYKFHKNESKNSKTTKK